MVKSKYYVAILHKSDNCQIPVKPYKSDLSLSNSGILQILGVHKQTSAKHLDI